MRFLTLNIGASKATLAEYSLSGKRKLTLTAYGSGDLSGIDVNDPAALSAALPPVLHEILRSKGIKPGPMVLSLSGQTVFPRFAKFPAVGDAAKLDQLVGYEIEQNVPFPIDEIVSDCQFLGTTPEGDKAALIVAAKLEGVRAVTETAQSVGMKPTIVDVSPIAVCNALRFANPKLSGCTVILDIGAKTTNLIILEDEKIYNRSIPVAGNAITKDIAQAFGCSLEEAEQLKIERGYVSLGGVTEDEDEVSDQVSKIVRNVLTRLHVEVSRSINFYRSQQGGSAPSQLFLTGGTVRLPQLAEFFMESLQVSVDFLNPFAGVAVGPRVNADELENDAFTMAESVGLALRETDLASIQLNLMPPELVEQARTIRRIPFIAVGALTFLAALGAAWYAESHLKDVAAAELELVQAKNAQLKSKEAALKVAQSSVNAETEKCDRFQQLILRRFETVWRLATIRESLMQIDGMWITAWEPITTSSRDDDDSRGKKEASAPLEAAKITIRGWKDAMTKAEDAWSKLNNGQKKTANVIVMDSLRKRVGLFAKVEPENMRELKGCLMEYTIKVTFAPTPSIVAAGKGKEAGK